MDIKFIKKYNSPNGLVGLIYNIDNDKIIVEVGGTALSTLEIHNLPEDALGKIFTPVIFAIYAELNEQGAKLDRISIDSEGAKIKGKIVCSREKINEIIKK